ncbi:MAG: FtsX-like permease family protein [Acidimicrobiia bacterium]
MARRMASDWLMLTAAAITILLATTLLAASPIYADAVNLASLHRTLADNEVTDSNLEVSARGRADGFARFDPIVRDQVADDFRATGARVYAQVVAASHEIPLGSDEVIDLASIQWLEGVEEHATLSEGDWPAEAGDLPELAIQEVTSTRTGLAVGDEVTLTNRRDPSLETTARIVGVFTANDPDDPFWFDDPLIGTGLEESGAFPDHGPFLTDLDSMITVFSPHSSLVNWRVFPRHQNLTVAGITPMRRSVETMDDGLNAALGEQTGPTGEVAVDFRVASGLGDSLRRAEQSVVVTRSNVLMLSVQLAVLAGYALMHTSGLLVEGRRVETGLLRSRGAGNGQVLAVSVMEGVLLTLPAVFLAPWLATQALRLLNRVGPLTSIGLGFEPVINQTSYLLSAFAATCCVVALAFPAYRSSRTFNESYIALGRQGTKGYAQRAGVDIALLVLAVTAFWQLKTRGVEISSTVRSRLGIDPLLIGAPALGLLAGGALALRTIPLLARLGERIAGARKSTVPALSAWQVARRPLRYARAALLLTMAVGVGFFAASYATTWTLSQNDQAAFQVGADVTVSPGHRPGSIPELQLRAAHESIEGVNRSMPVFTVSGQLSRTGRPTRFVALDAATAAEVVTIRDDLTDAAFPDLMERLAEQRPEIASIPLPGEPQALSVVMSVEAAIPCEDLQPEPGSGPPVPCLAPRARVVLQDGSGLLHRLDLGPVPVDQGEVRLETTLIDHVGEDPALPEYPLTLVALEIGIPVGTTPAREARVTISGLDVSDRPGGDWLPVLPQIGGAQWALTASSVTGAFLPPSIQRVSPDDLGILGLQISTVGNVPDQSVYFGMRPPQLELPQTFPVVVTNGILEETGIGVGDTIRLAGLRITRDTATVVAAIEAFPTVTPGSGTAAIIDLATIQMLGYEPGGRIEAPGEYWLDVDDRSTASVVSTLGRPPFDSTRVAERVERAITLQSDPIALGTIAALSLGFAASAILAAVGFTVSAVAAARERVAEFTLLRALGLSKRQLGVWLSIEQAVLVIMGLLFGTIVGLVLVSLILPLISVTQQGAIAFPVLIVAYPLNAILLLDLAVVVTLALVVVVLSVVVRRQGLAAQLRIGEG